MQVTSKQKALIFLREIVLKMRVDSVTTGLSPPSAPDPASMTSCVLPPDLGPGSRCVELFPYDVLSI